MKNILTRLGILFLLATFLGIAGCSHSKSSDGPRASQMLSTQDHPILRAPDEES